MAAPGGRELAVGVERRTSAPTADTTRHDNCHVERTTWPYECIAKDKHPNDVVYACLDHGIWWHVAEAS